MRLTLALGIAKEMRSSKYRFKIGKINAFETISSGVSLVAKTVSSGVSLVAKTVILSIGSLFQVAKLIKAPISFIVTPIALAMSAVGEKIDNKTLKEIAKGLDSWTLTGVSKDLIMTIHLIHFALRDKEGLSVKDVFQSTCGVVLGTEELYNQPAKNLWSNYLLEQNVWVETTTPCEAEIENNSNKLEKKDPSNNPGSFKRNIHRIGKYTSYLPTQGSPF